MWTPEIVRARFVEACDTERRMPKGGGGQGAPWPAYMHTFEDMNGWGTKRLAEERELRMRRIPPTAAAITRYYEVLRWTADFIADEKRRRVVWAWAWCRLTGSSFANRCRKEGWVKMTAYRRLTIAFETISAKLRNDGTLLRMPDENWVLPEQQISNTESGILGATDDSGPSASPSSQIFDGDRPGHTLTSLQAVAEFEKHLAQINKRRRREQERRKKLGMDAA